MARIVLIVFALVAASCVRAVDRVCGKHECSNICGHMCEPTCGNNSPNPLTCPRIQCSDSLTRDCRCDNGYVRDKTTGRCVLPINCPVPGTPTCGQNEQLGNCGRLCEKTCANPDLSRCAATSCSGNGCQCKEGFFRSEATDLCVRAENCPRKCCKGEILAACGKTCEGTCQSPRTPEICSRIKCGTQSCRCDLASGFVRNTVTGKCVRINQCPKQKKCPANSAPKLCGKVCEPTCGDPRERRCKIDPSRCTVDCRCLKGYVRNQVTKKCVKPGNCCSK